jgi:hypothetical protein
MLRGAAEMEEENARFRLAWQLSRWSCLTSPTEKGSQGETTGAESPDPHPLAARQAIAQRQPTVLKAQHHPLSETVILKQSTPFSRGKQGLTSTPDLEMWLRIDRGGRRTGVDP